jgi:hypothetical protein
MEARANRNLLKGVPIFNILRKGNYVTDGLSYIIAEYSNEFCIKEQTITGINSWYIHRIQVYQNRLFFADKNQTIHIMEIDNLNRTTWDPRNHAHGSWYTSSKVFASNSRERCVDIYNYEGIILDRISGLTHPGYCYVYGNRLYVQNYDMFGYEVFDIETYQKLFDINPLEPKTSYSDMVVVNDIHYFLLQKWNGNGQDSLFLHIYNAKTVEVTNILGADLEINYSISTYQNKLVITKSWDDHVNNQLFFFGLDLEFIGYQTIPYEIKCSCSDSDKLYVMTTDNKLITLF